MKLKNSHMRIFIVFLILFFSIIVLFLANISFGSVSIPLSEIFDVLINPNKDITAYKIVYFLRIPRMIEAFFLGGALGVSGFLMQTFFHNPIASPFVLGISSGAELFVALAMVVFLNIGFNISSTVLIIAAFIGSMVCMGFILIFSKKVKSSSVLIVAGIMVGYICSAFTDFIVTFANDNDIINLHNWSMGSFSSAAWENVKVIMIVVSLGSFAAFLLSKPIGAFQFGENYAKNVGVNIKSFRIMIILISSILSASVTAFAGSVSFVGVAVPHLIKSFVGTSKPIIIIPGCFIGGAVFCLFCDLIARTFFAPTEVSISSVTAIFGAPIVIFIIFKKKEKYLK